MDTIINDTPNRDTHILAGLITLIKCYGAEHAIAAANDLMEFAYANDLTLCKQGFHKDANGICVPDVG